MPEWRLGVRGELEAKNSPLAEVRRAKKRARAQRAWYLANNEKCRIGGRLNGMRLGGRSGFFANQKLERLVVHVLSRDDQADLASPPLQRLLAW